MNRLAILIAAVVGVVGLPAQQARETSLEVLPLRPNFYMIAGAGGNIAFQVGEDGVVVVDSGSAASADAVLAAIKKVTTQPIRYVINTSADPDHVGGNAALAKAGQTLFTQGGGAGIGADFLGGGASILAVEQVLTRMSGTRDRPSAFPVTAWPSETFNQPRKYMYLNGEGIEIFHQPGAHTDGDAIVFFRRSDVVVAGDVFDTTRFPVIDTAKGGSIHGEIQALQKLVDTAIPSVPIVSREAGTLVIPGHGRVCDQLDVVEYRDMVSIIRDRVRDFKKQGLTLEQIKAASPARGYTRRYGAATGSWTTNDFVEAVYRSLNQKVQ
ncbi:MAG TPA: MBL fold metallo-hydrolase [Bryobacteraceae bacterium]|jgi:glyoxylase-like metal-dependent hydrolase (beta-lactamase superfamily II)